MGEMSLNGALQVVQGVIRFQRALGMIRESLEKAVEGETLLANLDRNKAEKEILIASAEDSLAKITATLSDQKAILDKALVEIKVKVDAKYDELLVAKNKEVAFLEQTAAGIKEHIAASQAEVNNLNDQQNRLREEIDTTQKLLEAIKKQKDAILAKFT